jgi:hypothetical protein
MIKTSGRDVKRRKRIKEELEVIQGWGLRC